MALSKNSIYQGDSVGLLKKLAKGSVDLVFADPPFNIGYDYDVYNDARQTDDYLKWCRQWIQGVERCLKPNGTFWLAIGDEYAAELKIEAQKAGFLCRSWVIWYYTFGVNCVRGFSRSHTHLFHFIKDPQDFTFNSINPQNRVPSARQLVYADLRANPKGRLPDNTWIYRPQDAVDGFLPEHDTWYFSRVAGTFKEREGFHGCQMPEQLLGRIIRVSSHPNDLVVDPFSGSGTTLSVAKKLGRQWIGFELSQDYVKAIKQRLQKTSIGDSLDGPKDPVRSAPKTVKGKRRKTQAADQETEEGVIAAFRKAAGGYSADYLLCHQELNRKFIKTCRSLGVPGNDSLWNQLVLRLRKSKRLPKSTKKQKPITFKDMDRYSFASEIALRLLSVDYGLTVDNLLCSPDFASKLDQLAGAFAPGFSPFEYRWAALAIRKRAKASRRLAAKQFHGWLTKRLPRRIPVEQGVAPKYQQPGVYLISSDSRDLYVGESENVSHRIEQVLETPAWEDLEPQRAIILLAKEFDAQWKHAVQSVLVQRTESVLNSRLLHPELPKDAK